MNECYNNGDVESGERSYGVGGKRSKGSSIVGCCCCCCAWIVFSARSGFDCSAIAVLMCA